MSNINIVSTPQQNSFNIKTFIALHILSRTMSLNNLHYIYYECLSLYVLWLDIYIYVCWKWQRYFSMTDVKNKWKKKHGQMEDTFLYTKKVKGVSKFISQNYSKRDRNFLHSFIRLFVCVCVCFKDILRM